LRLWDYALAAWERAGVREACLELQDHHGQCVALLLWRAWAAGEGRRIDGGCLDTAVSVAGLWEHQIIAPLRAARRALDKIFEGLIDGATQRLRQAVRTSELEAERTLLETLETLSPSPSRAEGELAQQLADLMQAWNGHKAPAAAARDLSALLT
jgi:uncharacterized protein (TIGR02444 family)